MPARPFLPNGSELLPKGAGVLPSRGRLLPIGPGDGSGGSGPDADGARPTARHRATSLQGMLLAILMLLAPLSACAPTATAEGPGSAGSGDPTGPASSAPSEEPAAQEPTTGPPSSDPPTTAPTPTDPAAAPSEEGSAHGSSPSPEPSSSMVVEDGTALAMLGKLEVKGRAPKTGYDRDSFGWRDDLDRNGCDTRNDILRRDLEQIILKSGTGGCVVLRGTLDSPYSGQSVSFDRTDSTVDIDHVVALSDAWQSGAAGWGEETRRAFANDPLNLLAVESGLNRQKGDGYAATWLPPATDYRCEYVARQIAVKAKYDLWVKPAEADAMERVLGDCEGFGAVADGHAWPGTGDGDVIATEDQQPREPAPAPVTGGDSGSGDDVHFSNCDAARSADAAPVRVGDPGYGRHLDRDGDGTGCE